LKFTFFKWLFKKLVFENKAQVGSGSEVGRREVRSYTLRSYTLRSIILYIKIINLYSRLVMTYGAKKHFKFFLVVPNALEMVIVIFKT